MRVCALSEIAEPGAKGFYFRDDEGWLFIGLVVRNGGDTVGYVDFCPHAGWSMANPEGRYLTRTGQHILCSGHGALFTLDGLCVAGPCLGDQLQPWPLEVRDGEVFTA